MRPFKPVKPDFRPFILLLACVGLLTSGCVDKSIFNTYPHYYLSVESKNIETEITRLEKNIKADPDSETTAKSFYYLSPLYSHPKNPQPDYRKALKNFESYIRLDPEAGKKCDVQYLLSLFRQIEKLRGKNDLLKMDKARLKNDTSTLKGEKKQLTAENKNLQDIIEQLKLLDIQLEERRRAY